MKEYFRELVKNYKTHLMRAASMLLILMAFVRIMMGITYINAYTYLKLIKELDESLYTPTSVTSILIFVGGFAEFVFGISCAIKCEEYEHLKGCFIIGFTALVLTTAANIMQLYTGYGISYVAWITGFVTPVFGLIATYLRSKHKNIRRIN